MLVDYFFFRYYVISYKYIKHFKKKYALHKLSIKCRRLKRSVDFLKTSTSQRYRMIMIFNEDVSTLTIAALHQEVSGH